MTPIPHKHIKPGMFALVEIGDNVEKLPINNRVVVVKQTKHGLWQVRYNEKYYSIPQRFLRKVEQNIFKNLNTMVTYQEAIAAGVNSVHDLMINRDDLTKDQYDTAINVYFDSLREGGVNCEVKVLNSSYIIICHVPVFTVEWDINM